VGVSVIDHVLRAVDERVALNAFFHGSREPLPVGATLEARENLMRRQLGTEAVVEAQRPANMPSRTRSWFMTQDPCDVGRMGGGSFIYEVEPHGVAGPMNYDWIERIAKTRSWHEDFNDVPKYAASYWAGEPLGAHPQLEWLAPEITVLREARCSGRPWGNEGRRSS
jgi:hypothetical protein